MRPITPKKCRRMACGCFGVGLLFFFAGYLAEGRDWLFGAGLIAYFIGIVLLAVFFRCPHCGGSLARVSGHFCPHCGKPLDETGPKD